MYRLPEFLERALEGAATVITADPRQAFAIRIAWAERQRTRGHTVWPTPDVLPLSGWLARSWARAMSEGDDSTVEALLTQPQERTLWEQAAQDGATELLHPHGAARAGLRSWQRSHEWAIDLRAPGTGASEETRTFLAWAAQVSQRMRAHGWIDGSRALWRCPLESDVNGRDDFIMLGFDDEPPAICELLARLVDRGVNACRAPKRAGQTEGARLGLATVEAEVYAAARWARNRLELNPDDRLLIAIPDLAQRRGFVEYAFADVLEPATLLAQSPRQARVFALEENLALDRYPVVTTAIVALELAAGRLAFDAVSHWLRSPYLFAGTSAAGLRARLDAAMRCLAADELDLKTLIAVLAAVDRDGSDSALIAALRSFAEKLATGPHTPAEWSAAISSALTVIGWPGERPLESAEFQTVEKFHAALRELAMLDLLLGRLDLAAVVRALRRLLEQTPFQPETGDTPITITARLSDPVLSYDGIWISGLHAGNWPEAPRADPFIPWQLQLAAGIPEASAAGMLSRGRRTLGTWLASSPEVILSWPRRLDDEDCDVSPLIAGLPDADAQLAAPPTRSYAQVIRESAHLERIVDETAPSLKVAGRHVADARTLTLQSLCPFRAFAEQRLGARVLEQPRPGIDPRTRGRFLHRVLEQLWSALSDSEGLQQHSIEQREAVLDAAIRAARREVLERPRRWSHATLDLETERLRGLLRTWIELESTRAPFRILAVEQEIDCMFAGVPFGLRVDRIDELADGRRLLIDYKSGQASSRRWYGDRPDDPQMPLYALAVEQPPAAIAYAVLNATGCRFEGASAAPAVVDGLETVADWPGQLREWRTVIERLASEFAIGHAQVDPKRDACITCHLHSLCRIDELHARSALVHPDE